jgi:hypothetical protein
MMEIDGKTKSRVRGALHNAHIIHATEAQLAAQGLRRAAKATDVRRSCPLSCGIVVRLTMLIGSRASAFTVLRDIVTSTPG